MGGEAATADAAAHVGHGRSAAVSYLEFDPRLGAVRIIVQKHA
jgi:hypothetical protein